MGKLKIIVHGGAGPVAEEILAERNKVLEEACQRGFELLKSGSPEEAVEQAVNVLEDSEYFNAGRGAPLRLDGEVRLDASIMNSELKCGAVALMSGIKHAVSVAKLVMERTPHVILAGRAATEFALQFGFKKEDLRTESSIKRWLESRRELPDLPYEEVLQRLGRQAKLTAGETVGAIALKDGRIAVATSTGGLDVGIMHEGRVGDTPVIGAGTYCNEYGGASATGIGESIIKVVLAKKVVDFIESGLSPQEAAERGIKILLEKTGSRGGVIALDRDGNHGVVFSTARMGYAVKEG